MKGKEVPGKEKETNTGKVVVSTSELAGSTRLQRIDTSTAPAAMTDAVRASSDTSRASSPDTLFYDTRVSDHLDRQNPYDFWLLDGTGCQDASIDLASRDGGDTYVLVYAASQGRWELVDSGDDCLGSTNSCLARSFDSDTRYLLAVTSYDYLTFGLRPEFSYELLVTCADQGEPRLCGSRGLDSCGDGFYCDYDASVSNAACGRNDRPGVCKPMPDVCPLYYRPVCGCDGKTYGNACSAARAGADVSAEGACDSPLSSQGLGETCGGIAGLQCAEGLECNYGNNRSCTISDMAGTCVDPDNQEVCIQIYDPVCGCNGVTYSNDCMRQVAGVAFDHDGKCSAARSG